MQDTKGGKGEKIITSYNQYNSPSPNAAKKPFTRPSGSSSGAQRALLAVPAASSAW